MARKHNEDEVLLQLRKKNDVRVTQDGFVLVLNGKSTKGQFQKQNDLGNRSWGKIDFLVNHRGYKLLFTSEF